MSFAVPARLPATRKSASELLAWAMVASILLPGCGGGGGASASKRTSIKVTGLPAVLLAPGEEVRGLQVESEGKVVNLDSTGSGLLRVDSDKVEWKTSLAVNSGQGFLYKAPGMGGRFTVNASATNAEGATFTVDVATTVGIGRMMDALTRTSSDGRMGAYRAASVRLGQGRILQFGGDPGTYSPTPSDLITEYDAFGMQALGATKVLGKMATPRYHFTATLLQDGKRVLVCGGAPGKRVVTAAAELVDVTTGASKRLDHMTTARAWHTATLLVDGRVLLVGGENGKGATDNGSDTVATAEVFDPRTETFSPVGPLGGTRSTHTATLLKDGRVLIAGGRSYIASYDLAKVLNSAEVFDPTTGSFSKVGELGTARMAHAAVGLQDGRVLLLGGQTPESATPNTASTELYDPVARTFAKGPEMAAPRAQFNAVLLPSGKVAVMGGETRTFSIELFDPGTGTFAQKGELDSGLNTGWSWATYVPDPTETPEAPKGRVILFTAAPTLVGTNPVRAFFP